MIGKGNNKKSMAYVRNVVAFINNRIEINEMGYNVFNYADKPDFTMLELIRIIQYKLNLQSTKKRIPYWLGLMGGYFFDLLSFIIKKKLNISSVRVKSFVQLPNSIQKKFKTYLFRLIHLKMVSIIH